MTVCFDDSMATMSAQDPVFDTSFHPRLLHPRLWGSWLAVALLSLLAWVPARARDKLADYLAPLLLRVSTKQAYIADTNLKICFPHLDEAGRQALLLKSIRVGLKTFLGFGELTWRSPDFLKGRVKVSGWEHVEAERAAGRPMIFVVPHTWAVDMIGRYFPLQGIKMCTMMKSPKDAVFDWYINRERSKGGRIYERSVGIKPAIKALRSGDSFFYLPDQDHGREASLFVPFFNHPKATLPALPKLVKLTGARAVPILACYDEDQGGYRLEIEAPFDPYPTADLVADVNQMNRMVEQQLGRFPEQYMWFLKIFETQEHDQGEDGLYEAGIRRIRQGLPPEP
ncbi:lipid A biosynthesis myristoyltransferase [Aeromonas caviae]|nr:lipid A biosynthesis myristoyltransferase [Aeromonas caviae]BDS30752.1 lipid A biosynthesis myristoyltransferase [Aeromonas caviae]GKQ77371.1 lipid A biosynthesis myristoyltransferase [Aeromonas caviae]GKR03378.1 lipid A biosynthesis myristoyltransferase [Aeromonas caviae]GKR11779.1 lipid A biosynthesis myristoyltransferase [Aeromonas caviae]